MLTTAKFFQPGLNFLDIAYPSGAPYGVIFVHNKCLKTAKKKFYRGKHSSLFSVEEKKFFEIEISKKFPFSILILIGGNDHVSVL